MTKTYYFLVIVEIIYHGQENVNFSLFSTRHRGKQYAFFFPILRKVLVKYKMVNAVTSSNFSAIKILCNYAQSREHIVQYRLHCNLINYLNEYRTLTSAVNAIQK